MKAHRVKRGLLNVVIARRPDSHCEESRQSLRGAIFATKQSPNAQRLLRHFVPRNDENEAGARNDRRCGQAMVELAVFGSIILVVFGILLSFLQQFNNQQYAAMEAFRRGLEKACVYDGGSGGVGASVQYTLMQTRRQADLSNSFRKGSPTTLNASANVFWAVPETGKNPESLIVMRVNEDEKQAKPEDFTSNEDESFSTEEAQTSYVNIFDETTSKRETSGGIINTKTSTMNELLTTKIPYVVTKKETPDDYDDTNDVVVKEGTFLEFKQGLYWDENDKQYKYSEDKAGTKIERSRTWETEF